MNTPANITDAEWLVMRVLWSQDSATTSEIAAVVRREREVSTQTIKTLLRRLIDKQLVGYEIDPDDSRAFHYRALVARNDAIKQKSAAFISQIYQSDIGGFLAHFVDNGDLSEDELVRLQQKVAEKLRRKS